MTLSRRRRRGYAMLVALVLIALLTVIGSTSLTIAGVDNRVATFNRRHMLVLNTADAGTQHARYQLQTITPVDEGYDAADTGGMFVPEIDAETLYEGASFPMNQGIYEVDAVFQKCGNPPPGYSTEDSTVGYRSDYWDMHSTATFTDSTMSSTMNPARAEVVVTLRKVMRDSCKVR
jgi:type II secretory pathway pseudopilin PulG